MELIYTKQILVGIYIKTNGATWLCVEKDKTEVVTEMSIKADSILWVSQRAITMFYVKCMSDDEKERRLNAEREKVYKENTSLISSTHQLDDFSGSWSILQLVFKKSLWMYLRAVSDLISSTRMVEDMLGLGQLWSFNEMYARKWSATKRL